MIRRKVRVTCELSPKAPSEELSRNKVGAGILGDKLRRDAMT